MQEYINLEVGTIYRNRSNQLGFKDIFETDYDRDLNCMQEDILDMRKDMKMINDNINITLKLETQRQRVSQYDSYLYGSSPSNLFCLQSDRAAS